MEILHKIIGCISASGLFYLLGVLTLHPSFIMMKYLERKGFDCEYVLNQGHKIILSGCAITFIIITSVVFNCA